MVEVEVEVELNGKVKVEYFYENKIRKYSKWSSNLDSDIEEYFRIDL